MRRRSWSIATIIGFVVSGVVVSGGASAHPTESAGFSTAPPPSASTGGDYATDVLGDSWDFSNAEDVPPIPLVGTENSFGISLANGVLTVDAQANSTIKLIRTWGAELAWGRDGLHVPADASAYTRLSFSMNLDQKRNMGVHYWTESGAQNIIPFTVPGPGWASYDIDMTSPGLLGPSVWSGKIVRLEILAGGGFPGTPRFPIQLDWARLHRADTVAAPTNAPAVRVLTPSEEGGADYATVSGDPWDFGGTDDIVSTGDLRIRSFDNGNLNGTTFANDSFVELPLRTPLNTDRYHRATIDVCFGGGFSFANAPGGGMNARFAWYDDGGGTWSETQDIVIYPGCNRMTIDLATTPAIAVNDENTVYKAGWRGLHISALRFDLNEDPGTRDFSLNEIRLADDAAFSTTYPITFATDSSGTADIFATTTPGAWDGTKIGTISTIVGNNTFTWNGSGLPNGTYWVYVIVKGQGGTGSAYSTGPVRIERPVPPTPSCFVPLNPARLLDTRDGTGGNISALSSQAMTELNVMGVGGVPPTGATAVVLNVTVDAPLTSGFITAWPSGEAQPTVSNLNYVAGQTVPNLVTVKVGANGKVNLYNSEGFTSLVADVVGYYTAASSGCPGRFTAVTPKRVLDTREGAGTPVGAGQSINVAVTGGTTTVPAGASGVALNVTVDQPTSAGFLTVWPAGEARPLASSHNFVPGLTIANLVLAKVGSGGQVSIFNSGGSTHVVADIVGYFSSSGGTFIPVSPQRIADSRGGPAGPLGQGQTRTVDVANAGPVPGNATAAIVNVTSVNSSTPSFITVWPTGAAIPTASTLNPRPGVPVPNLAYLKLSSDGRLSIYNNSGTTDYIVDVFGYVVP
ncbi:MAG TPA: hypothetical protein VHN36_16535 [Ilumatobacteraceae bacterium]|nr:hypothetical protein [Ilumatobacteraceae bacterium]